MNRHESVAGKDSFCEFLAALINASDRSQVEIARMLDYDNPNMITMIKTGRSRLPPDKVAPLALTLGQDPGRMLRLWLETYMPQLLQDVDKYRGGFHAG